ncbi:MAG: hypothetical protein ABIF18_03935 [archaeon]
MVMNKRAQLFLLAAVIIVAVVISLGVISNQAIVNEEPTDFYDFSYEIKKEIGGVIDYEIYSDFDDEANLNIFVELLSENIRDKDPESEFIIIYGDNISGVKVVNEMADSIIADGQEVESEKTIVVSQICNINSCEDIELYADDFEEVGTWEINTTVLEGKDTIQIDVDGQIIEFPISRHKKVLFIIQKDVDDESFIAIG